MDAADLNQEQRDAVKMRLIRNRDSIGRLIKRMELRAWYSDDAARLCIEAAYNSLHAAVQIVCDTESRPFKERYDPSKSCSTPGLPIQVTDEVREKYKPLAERIPENGWARRKRRR